MKPQIKSPKKQPQQVAKKAQLLSQKPLQEIFPTQKSLAWHLLDIQSSLYIELNISLQQVTQLTSIYMKIIEKLNVQEDPRERYFKYKMQKLMAEPYIIRCFNTQFQGGNGALDYKRKEMEQKLEQESQKTSHKQILEQVINATAEKQKKMKQKIDQICNEHQQKLQKRIKQRKFRQASPRKSKNINNSRQLSRENSFTVDTEFQLSFDQDKDFRRLQRQVQEQEQFEMLTRKLEKEIKQGIQ